MEFEYSEKTRFLLTKLQGFMDEHIYPNEAAYYRQHEAGPRWETPPLLEDLKAKAKAAGLWNLFLPQSEYGAGLTNMEYAPLCEVMGRVGCAPEVFNCAAPDTGNMGTIERYGNAEQRSNGSSRCSRGRSAPPSR